ncbi:CHAT domain-containing protein [Streptomyces sp. NPDC055287]
MTGQGRSIPRSIGDAVLDFLNADADGMERVLREKQARLLTDDADWLLGRLIEQHRQDEDGESHVSYLRSRRWLLHRCREYGIDRGIAPYADISQEVREAVEQYLNIRSFSDLAAYVMSHQHLLLTSEADVLLEELLVRYRDDEVAQQHLTARRERLAACGRLGVRQAFSDEFIEASAELLEAVVRFLTAPAQEVRAVVERFQDLLLTDEAETVLQFMAASIQPSDDLPGMPPRRGLALLRSFRAHGLAAMSDVNPPPPTGLLPDGPDRTDEAAPHASRTTEQSERELSEELETLAGERGLISEHDVRQLLERRPDLAQVFHSGFAGRSISWYPSTPSHAPPLVEELTRAASAADWPRVLTLGAAILDITSRDEQPAFWARTHSIMGEALARITDGDRAENLERAIDHHRAAVEACGEEEAAQRDMSQDLLAQSYLRRVKGDPAQNVEEALATWRTLIETAGQDGADPWWEFRYAQALRTRMRGPKAENVEASITLLSELLAREDVREDPDLLNSARSQLAFAYLERTSVDNADAAERAAELLAHCTPPHNPTAELIPWVQWHRNMATARSQLPGNPTENWRIALDHLALIAEVCPRSTAPELWAENQRAVAALLLKHPAGRTVARALKAAELIESTLQVYTIEDYAKQWATAHHVAAGIYTDLFTTTNGEPRGTDQKAITHLEEALRVWTRENTPDWWSKIHMMLGTVYLHRADLLPDDHEGLDDAVDRGVHHLQRVLEVSTSDTDPVGRLKVLAHIGSVRFMRRRWHEALTVYVDAMRTADWVLGSAHTEAGRLSAANLSGWLFEPATYCLFRLGDPWAAQVCLEWGRARTLAEALALRDLDIAGLPQEQFERMRALRHDVRVLDAALRTRENDAERGDIATRLAETRRKLAGEIKHGRSSNPAFLQHRLRFQDLGEAVPVPGALVTPVVTDQGLVVFALVRNEDGTVDHFFTEDHRVTRASLRYMLVGTDDDPGWVRQHRAWRTGRADEEAWRQVLRSRLSLLWYMLAEPIETVLRQRVPEGTPVTLVPEGLLSLLPFHAASRAGDGTFCLLDRYTVSYAPSVFALRAGQRRLRAVRDAPTNVLAVVDPTGDLESAHAEGEHLEALLPAGSRTVLRGADATERCVTSAARGRTHLHFACHGSHDTHDVMNSGLRLSGSTLTLRTVLDPQFDLTTARLVTLSACETGLIDTTRAVDECVGLPTAFLQGGACGVISTLWPVRDEATGRLMRHFYEGHLDGGLHPAEALRKAQLWLRDSTEYSDPYYWAAFQYTGA